MNIPKEPHYRMKVAGETILEGHPADIRERIEQYIEDEVGLFLTLQEYVDEDGYEYYTHSEAFEDLSEEEWGVLESRFGLVDREQVMTHIDAFFNFSFEPV